jgi:hypothetical protein
VLLVRASASFFTLHGGGLLVRETCGTGTKTPKFVPVFSPRTNFAIGTLSLSSSFLIQRFIVLVSITLGVEFILRFP